MGGAGRWSRLRDWLLMGEALAEARKDDAEVSARTSAVKSARAYARAANWLLDSGEELSPAPALTLYREALLGLVADDEPTRRALAAAIEASPESWQGSPGPTPEDQKQAAQELLRRCLSLQLRLRDQPDAPDLVRDITATRARLHVLLVQAESTHGHKLRTVLRARRRRMGFAAALLGVVLLAGTALSILFFLPKDLAQDKPWHTSSALPLIYTAKVLFHTIEEQNPWFEVDLLRPTTVRRLHIKNRGDCCSERAVPLVVEVTNDRSSWQQVARTDSPFTEWRPSFSPVKARYVRLRVPRFTTFHLEAVQVY